MAAGPGNALGRQVRRAVRLPEPDDRADGQLLAHFLADRDEPAFEALVRRHAAMVLGVCRRVVGNAADADDAFQAAFVVLVRRGGELTGRATVGDWLYGVAYRTALKARAMAVKRRAREHAAARSVEAPPAADPPDWLPVLDEELNRLPQKYREPLVLCELEGRPRKEVAGRLGVPEGTLSSRLAVAKKMLADRLRKRGVAAPAGLLAAAVAQTAEALPPSLLHSTTRAASGDVVGPVHQIVTEVTRMMFLTKLRAGALVLAVVLAGSVAGMTALSRAAAPEPKPAAPVVARDGVTVKELREKSEAARDALQGTWELQKRTTDDKEVDDPFVYYRHTFADRTVKIEYLTKEELRPGEGPYKHESESSFTVNPTATPPEITIFRKDFLIMGIYDLDGDRLKIAFHGISELERPRGFAVKDKRVADLPLGVWEFKRKRPEKESPVAARADELVWEKEFNKVYSLKDGEYVKRVAPPYIDERKEYMYRVWYRNKQTPEEERRAREHLDREKLYLALFLDFDGNQLTTRTAVSATWLADRPNLQNGEKMLNVWDTVTLVTGRRPPEVVIDPKSREHPLLSTKEEVVEGASVRGVLSVGGDFVIRKDAPLEKLAPQLEKILRDECGLDVRLTVKEEEQEVYVVGEKFALAPRAWRKADEIDLYAEERVLRKDFDRTKSGDGAADGVQSEWAVHTPATLARHVGEFVNVRMVWDRELPTAPRFHVYRHERPPGTATPEQKAADHDPEKVLANVSEQTGLTFKKERRKVKVLVVEAK